MKSNKKIFILAGLLVSLVISSTAFGWGKGDRDYTGNMDKFFTRIEKKLNLTAEQSPKVKAIFQEVSDKFKEMRDAAPADGFTQVADSFRSDTFDPDLLGKQMNERLAAMTERMNFVSLKMNEFHAILTPEQRNTFADMMSRFNKDGRGRHGGNRGWF